jgi:hypothetical protein
VEGIVVNAVGMREEGLNRLQQSSLPMVLIDRKIPDFACDVVGLDNTQAATTATEHLIEQGFEALLFLSEPLGTVNTRGNAWMPFEPRSPATPAWWPKTPKRRYTKPARSITPCASSTPPWDAQSGDLRQRRIDAASCPLAETHWSALGQRYRPARL